MSLHYKKEEAEELYSRFLENTISEEEKVLLEKWLHSHGIENSSDLTDEELLQAVDEMRLVLELQIPALRTHSKFAKISVWKYGLAAACILLFILIGGGIWWDLHKTTQGDSNWAKNLPEVVESGLPKMMVLGSGQLIPLEGLEPGLIEENDHYRLHLNEDKQFKYELKEGVTALPESEWVQLHVGPVVGYSLAFTDGSKVWLNAGSIFNFPTHFGEGERKVKLNGEGYFEVAKGAKKFIVETSRQSVEVLGTKFLVSSYTEDNFDKTSLIEGKVNVLGSSENPFFVELTPGFEVLSQIEQGRTISKIRNPGRLAPWRDGNLYFENDDIFQVMTKIRRAYGVVARYPEKPILARFTGIASRDQKLSTMLLTLEKITGLKFELKGGEVYIRHQ